MSIDSKRLDDIEWGKKDFFDEYEVKELIRLARLGLWAEQHAIPALRRYELHKLVSVDTGEASYPVQDALAAIPATAPGGDE